MNPLNPLPRPPIQPNTPIACTEVWSALLPHHRAHVERVLLLVCRHLAEVGEAAPPLTPSPAEVGHE